MLKRRKFCRFSRKGPIALGLFILGIGASPGLLAQTSSNITGKLSLVTTVNLLQQAQSITQSQGADAGDRALEAVSPEFEAQRRREVGRITSHARSLDSSLDNLFFNPLLLAPSVGNAVSVHALSVNPTPSGFGFNGLTHADQRNANGGNQFSVEPPTPALAVGEGFLLDGVNNAVQVYSASGVALLPTAVSSNQLFGLAPAINRQTGVNGPFPTDMRTFYDSDTRRWIVLQQAQLNDAQGNLLNQSRVWMAVSQTPDPTGTYNIYMRDTTNPTQAGCPCYLDYPLLGADQSGLYITFNYFNTASLQFANLTTVWAISKASLASGAFSPTAVEFVLPIATGFEFALYPAAIPPGSRSLAASNGAEYFVSSLAAGNSLAVWVVTNTNSLQTSSPNLTLAFTTVATEAYSKPPSSLPQRPGILPYGSSLTPPGSLPFIDPANRTDTRIQSVMYVGGRLYATLGTQVTDESGHSVAGGAYFILSRKLLGGLLALDTVRQGYLLVNSNHLLRPVLAVNSQGRGAVAFTLVGPDYYPSAAYVPIDTFTTGSAVQIVGAGVAPVDGFTGYAPHGTSDYWGDSSAAVASSDGSIWFSSEYIPDAPRTQLANWGTYVAQYRP